MAGRVNKQPHLDNHQFYNGFYKYLDDLDPPFYIAK